MSFSPPYLMFLGDAPDQLAAKTAFGVNFWRPEWCVGQLRLPDCKADLGLPDMTIEQAKEAGVRTLIAGVANRGGRIGADWVGVFEQAIDAGFDIASGLHSKVADLPGLSERAAANGKHISDVRHPSRAFDVANGKPRPGKRLLTVGTDCSIGKMFTSLAIEKEMKTRGMKASFRATGQTGIFIAGDGVSVDAVVADFISGAAEWLTPANDPDHWDIVEGQGSLFHASFAGVSMGLLHGSQADALVMCHAPGRAHMRGLPDVALPDVADCIALNESCARLTNPNAKVIGLACNTAHMSDAEAEKAMGDLEDSFSMPCVDPVRTGVAKLVDRLA